MDFVPTLPWLRRAYGDGLSVSDVVEKVYDRIAEIGDPAIFISLRDKAEVLADGQALGDFDPDLPLWGVPFVVKDNIDVAGMVTTAACPAYAYTADADAHVVAQLRAAGALLIGKTNLDQFATGLVGVRSPYGVPRNAIDPDIVPGGSSSGSGVAVAHGIVTFSLGTDTAGSGRVPAALNNIVGLKPTLGALSARGVVPACRSVETVSIFALSAEDAYRVFQVAADYDPGDAFARPVAAPDLARAPIAPVVGVPDAASREFFGDAVQAQAFDEGVALLRASGAEVREIDLNPFYQVAEMLYEGAWVAERHTVIEDLLRRDPEAILPVTRAIIGRAEGMSAADAFRGIYRLKELSRLAEAQMAGLDLLCVPSIPTFYSCADLEADPVTPNSRLGTYTNFVNLMDMCALAVPTPARADGRPGSVTLIAKAGQDGLLAAMAETFEMAGDRTLGATGAMRESRSEPLDCASTHLQIAVCGAHMSGLPLNGDMKRLGAVFQREAETLPEYRLFALPGGPPERPGLVRVGDGGSAIAVEVWAMPRDSVGDFLASIPAPLSLGRVALDDGAQVTGFLCEAWAVNQARDITDLGGWRSYLAQAG
ncbi:allophanate hydrolase [Ponticoccus sp. SC2-23]|uniref:allophanate hydrolase n=1 Tax=Alexandriicola marinus TaxID=2081710 RepID=UPI000FD6DDA5|nr:allophanate hydrolase [Alexandriicola marinus]MBM1221606.1 allophanate hydrolase [Ponticoccus sp. SC6-9]MBM1226647.1 allophanate hydrolase [Ponticoccus sp. SC6-15]MBM1230598.1 allophanate hydrolase [Ponticoccus sp. SC6-38]MBM1235121.1 allophanate hydrolase [Ponticoccus sp. SC6-45]MBM1239619.1 allophanate hydrolase [Ponticoccus sp. SC6-49]MBM1243401.1 allophanate hydrolase [Ponticoccus sp. SC2-64]MBM1248645.1 allophanate hydrolase [Ponticoccus sp. SC6-42]MBM1253230.1 allophanate hydrolase